MNPYVLLALAVGLVAACGGAYWQGRTDGRNGERAANIEATQAAAAAIEADRQTQQQKAKSLSRRLEAQIATQAVTNRTISDQLEAALGKANLPASCDLTDDILHVWNDANRGSASQPGGELHGSGTAITGAKIQGTP